MFGKAKGVSLWMGSLGRSQGQNPRGRRFIHSKSFFCHHGLVKRDFFHPMDSLESVMPNVQSLKPYMLNPNILVRDVEKMHNTYWTIRASYFTQNIAHQRERVQPQAQWGAGGGRVASWVGRWHRWGAWLGGMIVRTMVLIMEILLMKRSIVQKMCI